MSSKNIQAPILNEQPNSDLRQIAHDLRSPISALNIISSMTEIPEASRELLEMAINRLQDIANRLDSNE